MGSQWRLNGSQERFRVSQGVGSKWSQGHFREVLGVLSGVFGVSGAFQESPWLAPGNF